MRSSGKRVDLSVYATALVAVSSFLPWIDAKWVSTSCDDGTGALTVVGIIGWLCGAGVLVVSLVNARREDRTWRDLMLLPCVVVSLVGLVLAFGAGPDCGGIWS